MGAHPYWYFTEYDTDADAALQRLRHQEFIAGRYNPVEMFVHFPVDPAKPSAGAQHESIEEAREAAGEDGTRSILDIDQVGDVPGFGIAARLDEAALEDLFGTTEPTRDMVESDMAFFDEIERGNAIYFTIYRKGRPHGLFFGGYSYD